MKIPCSMCWSALALGVAGALPSTAHAVVIYDEIIVQNAMGTVLASVSAAPADILANPYNIYYVAGIDVDPDEKGDFGEVVDGDGNQLEIFGTPDGGPDGPDLGFAGQGIAASYFVQDPVLDTGVPIDLTKYLSLTLQAVGDTATFIVATGPDSAVPEPLSWAMMVTGFAAVGYGMRRKIPVARTALAER